MKIAVATLLTTFTFATAVLAEDVTVQLTDVHLCCEGCTSKAEKAGTSIDGVAAVADEDSETVALTGPDTASLQKAVDAITAAGFFGKSSDSGVHMHGNTGAKGKNVKSLTVVDVHLCCGSCVSRVKKAVEAVSGATGHTAEKNATSFEVTGDFNDREFFEALQNNGLNGKVGS